MHYPFKGAGGHTSCVVPPRFRYPSDGRTGDVPAVRHVRSIVRRLHNAPVQPRRNRHRLRLEWLAERLAPAFDTTLSLAATANVTRTVASGTATYEATASGAKVSWLEVA